MRIHLVDGTYELFRQYYGVPSATSPDGKEVGATRGLLRSLYALVRSEGATHVGCAFDHVIESYRNKLFDGYKTGAGIDPVLWQQFPLAERVAEALGFVCWPMTEFEADDAIGTAASRYSKDDRVEQVCICSPDKDFAQCVTDDRIVLVDRRRRVTLNEQAVVEKFGVPPDAIADWLALVGDTSDGIPGVPRWGAKSASLVLARYGSLGDIPQEASQWDIPVRGAAGLARTLNEHRNEAKLYRTLATLRLDVPLAEHVDDLLWQGADRAKLTALCEEIGDGDFIARITQWRHNR